MSANRRLPLNDITNATLYGRGDNSKAIEHGDDNLRIDDTPIKFNLQAESTAPTKTRSALPQTLSTLVSEGPNALTFLALTKEDERYSPVSNTLHPPSHNQQPWACTVSVAQSPVLPASNRTAGTPLSDQDADFDVDHYYNTMDENKLFFGGNRPMLVGASETAVGEGGAEPELSNAGSGADRTIQMHDGDVEMVMKAPSKRAPSPTPLLDLLVVQKKRVRQNMPALSRSAFQVGVDAGILYAKEPQVVAFTDDDNMLDSYAYQHAMIMYWRLTRNLTFDAIKDIYNKKFDQSVGMESIRKRFHKGFHDHDRKLLGFPLYKGYGAKDLNGNSGEDQTETATLNNNKTQKETKLDVPYSQTVKGDRRQYRAVATHWHEKNMIWRWRKWMHMDWSDIRNKLEKQYNWSLGIGTVRKYYDEVNARMNHEKVAAEVPKDGSGCLRRDGSGRFLLNEKRILKPRSNSV